MFLANIAKLHRTITIKSNTPPFKVPSLSQYNNTLYHSSVSCSRVNELYISNSSLTTSGLSASAE